MQGVGVCVWDLIFGSLIIFIIFFSKKITMSVVVCLLLSGPFSTLEIWDKWYQPGIYFCIHMSNASPEEIKLVTEWAKAINAVMVSPIPTAWCDISVLKAELLLWQTARQRFPQATHYFMASEKSIPIVSAPVLLNRSAAWPPFQSYLETFQDGLVMATVPRVACVALQITLKKFLKMKELPYTAGGQFFALAAPAFDRLESVLIIAIQALETFPWSRWAGQRRCFSPEEWLPQTLLMAMCGCGSNLQKGILVADAFDLDKDNEEHLRSKLFTDQELHHVLPAVMKPPTTAWALRKVQPSPWLIQYLLHKKVIF